MPDRPTPQSQKTAALKSGKAEGRKPRLAARRRHDTRHYIPRRLPTKASLRPRWPLLGLLGVGLIGWIAILIYGLNI